MLHKPTALSRSVTGQEAKNGSEILLSAPSTLQDRVFAAKHIHAEQVRLLFRFSLVGYLAELLVTFLLGAILWNEFSNRPDLFVWFAAALLIMVGRYGLYKWFIVANPVQDNLATWERRSRHWGIDGADPVRCGIPSSGRSHQRDRWP